MGLGGWGEGLAGLGDVLSVEPSLGKATGRDQVELYTPLPHLLLLGALPTPPILPKRSGRDLLVAWFNSLQKPAPYSGVTEKHVCTHPI